MKGIDKYEVLRNAERISTLLKFISSVDGVAVGECTLTIPRDTVRVLAESAEIVAQYLAKIMREDDGVHREIEVIGDKMHMKRPCMKADRNLLLAVRNAR